MKIVTVVGARPQFIKAAGVSRVLAENYKNRLEEIVLHTGQHYDENMSAVFFADLDLPEPRYNLGIRTQHHGAMTGRMLESIEQILLQEKPGLLLVYGDTNSTLAGALAAAKLHIPIAHVEAGLRSNNMAMAEEINRILVDRVSTYLFCPSSSAVRNLKAEGITKGIFQTGDVTYDATLFFSERAGQRSRILESLNLVPGQFALATCHRAENTDDHVRLNEILRTLATLAESLPVVFLMHPRTAKKIEEFSYSHLLKKLSVSPPLSYLDTLALQSKAKLILTDSGGMQKEAFFHRVPCITLREETEWVETVSAGCNWLVGSGGQRALDAISKIPSVLPDAENPYGTGNASQEIVRHIFEATLH